MFPQLFHIGKFSLPTYGFLVSLGVLLGLWISVRNSERLGYNGENSWNLGILVVLCGILGAKVLYVINEWGYYSSHVSEIFSINTLQAGGVFSGGLLAAFVAAGWYVWKHHMPALGTCDAFAPGLALGHLMVVLPFVVRLLVTAFSTMPRDLEDAAATLGARPLAGFLHVTLPLAAPGAIAAATLSFLLSFDETVISLFLVGPRLTTLPVTLFHYAETRSDPMLAALAGSLMVLTLAIVVTVDRLVGVTRALGRA